MDKITEFAEVYRNTVIGLLHFQKTFFFKIKSSNSSIFKEFAIFDTHIHLTTNYGIVPKFHSKEILKSA